MITIGYNKSSLIGNNALYRSEVFDMLHSRDDNEQHMDLPTFPEDAEVASAEVPSMPDSQTEFLQGTYLIILVFFFH